MKRLVLLFSLVLCYCQAISQVHGNVDTSNIKTLTEWWRADNKGYGINPKGTLNSGMTWLQSFADADGALVLYTYDSVRTWRLRFPGDTENVFTWVGGDANLKRGDFNGDGVVDYVDFHGNIYFGAANGALPSSSPVLPEGTRIFPQIVYDLNRDGYDDYFTFESELKIVWGAKSLAEMKVDVRPLPMARQFLGYYVTQSKELRLVTRFGEYIYYDRPPYMKVLADGYSIASLSFDKATSAVQYIELDSVVKSTPDSTGVYCVGVVHNTKGSSYWVAMSTISGSTLNTELSVFDLSKDRLDLVTKVRMDSIAFLRSLSHSMLGDSSSTFCVWKIRALESDTSDLLFMSGDLSDGIRVRARYSINQPVAMCSVADRNGDGVGDLCVSGSLGIHSFRVVQGTSLVASVADDPAAECPTSIESISPIPITTSGVVSIDIRVLTTQSCTLHLYDARGKYCGLLWGGCLEAGLSRVRCDLSALSLTAGQYTVSLRADRSVSKSIITVSE